MADHYQYVASIGLIALAAAGIAMALRTKPVFKWVCCGALLLTLGLLTWRQAGMYKDIETLWRTTIARNPGCWMACHNLGYLLCHTGRGDEGIIYLQKAVEMHLNWESAQYSLGTALAQKGELNEAIVHFRKALEIKPDYTNAHFNLGVALEFKGEVDAAIVHLQKFVELRPEVAVAHNDLGAAWLQKGQINEAIACYQKAVELDPHNSEYQNNLGCALLQRGEVREAVAHYQTALEIQPENAIACKNLAWILATSPEASIRNGPKAVELAERAVRLTGGADPILVGTLAAAYAEAGRFPDAVTTAQRAGQMAVYLNKIPLAEATGAQIQLYQAGTPFRDTSLTNTPVRRGLP